MLAGRARFEHRAIRGDARLRAARSAAAYARPELPDRTGRYFSSGADSQGRHSHSSGNGGKAEARWSSLGRSLRTSPRPPFVEAKGEV